MFPAHRPRRLRSSPAIRRLTRETVLAPVHLIQPLFIVPGEGVKNPVASMPGVYQLSIDQALEPARQALALGLGGVILFGVPSVKDAAGSDAVDPEGIVQRAIRAIKRETPELYLLADLCLCEYTSHGHCGLLKGHEVDNDPTLEILGRAAVSYAQAGVDMVAPSGMMDGMVGAIRRALDGAGHESLPILSYAVKYASAFYGPFRDAAESAPQFGDRRSYQMDPANRREALREVDLDLAEGADAVMVKPGLAYLDMVREVRDRVEVPVAAYNVSGEYAMVKAAAERGWIDERRIVLESLTAFRRAGADWILTYHAAQAAQWLREEAPG
ncbi:MAG: porphobilinogen synthase [Magnetococcales bacterium]|nr:porphobilinogen synthase [Magnetococcales bacterium]